MVTLSSIFSGRKRLLRLFLFAFLPVPSIHAADLSILFSKLRHDQAMYVRRANTKITEIAIERAGCFGRCPVYFATISADGQITYKGEKFVDKIGTYTGHISTVEFKKLQSGSNPRASLI